MAIVVLILFVELLLAIVLPAPNMGAPIRRLLGIRRGETELEPDSKVYARASRLMAIWMQARVMKAARVSARFS
jgi:hypothetical protein